MRDFREDKTFFSNQKHQGKIRLVTISLEKNHTVPKKNVKVPYSFEDTLKLF